VREFPENIFYADVVRGREPTRRSTINFTGSDPLVALEKFYDQSEQRIARFFQLGEEEFAVVIEHPDCDKAWLAALTVEQVKALETTETINLLETRLVRWFCGCNQARMLEVLAPVMRADPVELFGEHEKIEIRCPRCAARYTITREAMEAKVADKK
jgi:molecular chaperone Hsp33